MLKLLHVVAIGALISSAVYAYSIKYETTFAAEELQKLKKRAIKERDAIAVLKAEWQHHNQPERLQALADRHLDLQPLAVGQITRLADVPMRGPKTDSIGRKLEDLGVFGATETPASKPSPSRTPSANTSPNGGRP